jgi:hypothetical protein
MLQDSCSMRGLENSLRYEGASVNFEEYWKRITQNMERKYPRGSICDMPQQCGDSRGASFTEALLDDCLNPSLEQSPDDVPPEVIRHL